MFVLSYCLSLEWKSAYVKALLIPLRRYMTHHSRSIVQQSLISADIVLSISYIVLDHSKFSKCSYTQEFLLQVVLHRFNISKPCINFHIWVILHEMKCKNICSNQSWLEIGVNNEAITTTRMTTHVRTSNLNPSGGISFRICIPILYGNAQCIESIIKFFKYDLIINILYKLCILIGRLKVRIIFIAGVIHFVLSFG